MFGEKLDVVAAPIVHEAREALDALRRELASREALLPDRNTDEREIQHALDNGALVVVVPTVDTVAEAVHAKVTSGRGQRVT